MNHITFLIFPNIMASSVSLPLEMLNAADNIRRSQFKNKGRLRISLAAETKKPVKTSGGLSLIPDTRIKDVRNTDLLVIPALWRNPETTVKNNYSLCEHIKRLSSLYTKVCAVGTGSTFLAEAGILEHRPATTHWYYFDQMEQQYPNVHWKRKHLITQSDSIYCAGSINSIADLTIHFIESGFNKTIAKRVESQFSPEIRRAYNDHLFDNNPEGSHQDELISHAQQIIQDSFATEIDFKLLAERSGIAYRTFQRRFKSATQYSPLRYQQYLRIKHATDLLKNSNASIQDIAELVGYIDASHFSHVFKNHTQQTPNNYRQAVRGKLFNIKP